VPARAEGENMSAHLLRTIAAGICVMLPGLAQAQDVAAFYKGRR